MVGQVFGPLEWTGEAHTLLTALLSEPRCR